MNLVDSKKAAYASASGKNKNQKQMKKSSILKLVIILGGIEKAGQPMTFRAVGQPFYQTNLKLIHWVTMKPIELSLTVGRREPHTTGQIKDKVGFMRISPQSSTDFLDP